MRDRRRAKMSLELFRDCLILRPRGKGKAETTTDALKETSGLGHKNPDPMGRAARSTHCFSQLLRRRRIGGRIYWRLILHDERFFGAANI